MSAIGTVVSVSVASSASLVALSFDTIRSWFGHPGTRSRSEDVDEQVSLERRDQDGTVIERVSRRIPAGQAQALTFELRKLPDQGPST